MDERTPEAWIALLAQGGPVMLVLLAMSVVACAIVLAKLYQFSRCRLRRSRPLIDRAVERARGGEYEPAERMLAECPSPVARVVESALTTMLDSGMTAASAEVEIGRVGTREIRALESWLRGLSSIAHLSPLLGLLGTVFGMIAAFMQIQSAGARVDPSVLSGGIWQALLTTAFGLTVALPSMAAFHFLEGEVDRARAEMRDKALTLTVHFGKAAGEGEPVEEPRVAGERYGV